MKYLQKTLLLLISLLAFRQMAWTQTPISVNNATELQNALNNGTVNLINLGRDINLNSELVSSQTNIIDLNTKTLNCGTHRVRVTAETLVVQSTYDGGTIIGGGADAGCTFYVENGATLDLESGTIMAANRPVTNGGVIYNAGTLEIYGGSISGGNAINGGGVYNAGTMFMGGGTSDESGVYIDGIRVPFNFHTLTEKPVINVNLLA